MPLLSSRASCPSEAPGSVAVGRLPLHAGLFLLSSFSFLSASTLPAPPLTLLFFPFTSLPFQSFPLPFVLLSRFLYPALPLPCLLPCVPLSLSLRHSVCLSLCFSVSLSLFLLVCFLSPLLSPVPLCHPLFLSHYFCVSVFISLSYVSLFFRSFGLIRPPHPGRKKPCAAG